MKLYYLHIIIKIGIIFKKVDIIRVLIQDYFMLVYFLNLFLIDLFARFNACIFESYISDVQPNLEAKYLFRADGLFQYRDII